MNKRASDWWIAISVIVCSIALFAALALGLSGRVFIAGGHTVRVRFQDVTGVKVSSQVKYAGAPAGTVSGVRMLTATERAADPGHLVEVALNILPDVPALTKSVQVSIAADTLLSDKFILLEDEGTGPGAAPLGADEILEGVTPTTFDKLARNVDEAIEGIRKTVGTDASDETKDLFTRINQIVDETQVLLRELQPVVKDAGTVVTDAKVAVAEARGLMGDNKAGLERAISRLDSAAASVESLAKKGEALVRDNEKNISASFSGLRVTSDNLKVASTYSKFLLRDLAQRPSRLIWGGGKAPELPDEQQILRARQPIPDR